MTERTCTAVDVTWLLVRLSCERCIHSRRMISVFMFDDSRLAPHQLLCLNPRYKGRLWVRHVWSTALYYRLAPLTSPCVPRTCRLRHPVNINGTELRTTSHDLFELSDGRSLVPSEMYHLNGPYRQDASNHLASFYRNENEKACDVSACR